MDTKNSNNVLQVETTSRAAVFNIFVCGDIKLHVIGLPGAVATPLDDTVVVSHGAHQLKVVRIWSRFYQHGARSRAERGRHHTLQ